MKTLSILQPWAFLIVRPDVTDPAERARLRSIAAIKDVENRTWPTRERGEVYVHAGKRLNLDPLYSLELQFKRGCNLPAEVLDVVKLLQRQPELMQLGGIIGTMTIGNCSRSLNSPWKDDDAYGFGLADSAPVPFRPYKGMLGFFEVAEPIESTCIECGCTDSRACPGGCMWVRLHFAAGLGVCSSCSYYRWDCGDRNLSGAAQDNAVEVPDA